MKERKHWGKIWSGFKAGESGAFEEIYNEFSSPLFSYGSKITKDRDLLIDSIHDLFIDLYKYDLVLRKPEYLEFYLFKSLKNKLVRAIKQQKSVQLVDNEHIISFDLKFDFEDEFITRDFERIQLDTLTDILAKLDPAKRELIFLKFNTGLKNTEIADILNMKAETVKKQLYRLLKSIHDTYGPKLMELLVICIKV